MTDINTSDLKRVAAQLRSVDPALEKDFQRDLAAGGEIVLRAARANANAVSSRIGATGRVRRRGTRVKVQFGGDAAPHAAAFEHHGLSGSFRHPVFGNREVWVSQPAHPFLTPAAEDKTDEVVALTLAAVDVALLRLR